MNRLCSVSLPDDRTYSPWVARVAETLAAGAVDEPQPPEPPARSRHRRRWLWLAAVAVLVAAVVGGGLRLSSGPEPVTQRDVQQAVKKGVDAALEKERSAPPNATQAYQAILPSLVLVSTDRASAGRAESGTGAGVVINQNGEILTALHVVEGAESISATFADGTEAEASIVSSEAEHDIAVLRPRSLPEVVVPAVMGGGTRVGDEVFAVGHPLGLARSLTAGVVSALNRTIRPEEGRTLEGLIQFDAAVNPGNSGGPLLNSAGHVVGVVTALANPSNQPFFVGISFAVPIATAGGAAGGPLQ